MSAMKPTPQESFSCAGSNSPKPCGPKPCALIVILALPRRGFCPCRGVEHTSLRAPVPFLLNRQRRRKIMGQAPEGEPFFWRQPSCRPAIFPARQSPAAYPPRSGAPSPSAAGPRASLPVPISTPKEKTRRKTGRAARASGHRNRTAILSYAEHGRSRAIAQERTHPPFCRGKRGAQAYGIGLCGFRLPQCPTVLVDHGL